MNRHRVIRAGAGVTAILLVGLFATGCAKYATQEDLQTLDTQKQAALAAQQKMQELETSRADLAKQVADRTAELQQVKAERMAVRQRLTEQGVKLPPLEAGEQMAAPAEMKQMEAPAKTEEPAKVKEPAAEQIETPAEGAQPDTSTVAPQEETPELEQQEPGELEQPEQEEQKEEPEDIFGYASSWGRGR